MERAADEDSREMLSFLWILRSWLLQCSAHGVPKVISYTNFHRKIFWLSAVVLSALAFLYQITSMLIDVYQYPVTVNLQIVHQDKLDFPTVTLCNSNKIKESLLRIYAKGDSDLHKVITFEDFNSIGLRDIYKELVAAKSAAILLGNETETNSTSTVNNSTATSFESFLSDPIPRCESDYDYSGALPANFECLEDENVCISPDWICDDYVDCSEGSDEDTKFCGSRRCDKGQYECQNGACIDIRKR